MKILVNLKALDNEMIYEPLWPEDRFVLQKIMYSNIITQKELLDLARLCIRYQHRFYRYETKTFFKILLKKSGYSNFQELYKATQKLYMHS